MARCLKCVRCGPCDCPEAPDAGWHDERVLDVRGRVALTPQGRRELGPGLTPRPGQVITVNRQGATAGFTPHHRTRPSPPADEGFVVPVPPQRSFAFNLPTLLPGVGLRLRSDFVGGVGAVMHWDLRLTDGWTDREARLSPYAWWPTSPSAQLFDHSGAGGAVLAPDGGAVAVTVHLVDLRTSGGWGHVHRFPPPEPDPAPFEAEVAPLPPLPPTLPPDSPTPVTRTVYWSAMVVPHGSGLRALLLRGLHARYNPDDPGAYPIRLEAMWLDVSGTGEIGGWSSAEIELGDWRPTHHAAVRTAATPDGTVYIQFAGRWARFESGALTVLAGAPDASVPLLRTPEPNAAGETVLPPIPWQLSGDPWGETPTPGAPPNRFRPLVVVDGDPSWRDRSPLTATVTAVTRLGGGYTLLTLDQLPTGLVRNWLGVPGTPVPHLPGLICADPDRVIERQYPPGATITWETTQAPPFAVAAPVAVPRLDTTPLEWRLRGLPAHPLVEPQMPPLYWPWEGSVFVDIINVPDFDLAPGALGGVEHYPAALAVSAGQTNLTPARLTVPALTPRLASRGRWTVPAGTHTLTVTWPAVSPHTRAATWYAALRLPWTLVERGGVLIEMDAARINPPDRNRAWLQVPRQQVVPGTPSVLRVTTDRPLTVQLAQLSLTTTEQP